MSVTNHAAPLQLITQAYRNLERMRQQLEDTQKLLQECMMGANQGSFTSLPPLRAMSPPLPNDKLNNINNNNNNSANSFLKVNTVEDEEQKSDNEEEDEDGPAVQDEEDDSDSDSKPFTLHLDPCGSHKKQGSSGGLSLDSRDHEILSRESEITLEHSGELSFRSPLPITGIIVKENHDINLLNNYLEEHSVTSIVLERSYGESAASSVQGLLQDDEDFTDRYADDGMTARTEEHLTRPKPIYHDSLNLEIDQSPKESARASIKKCASGSDIQDHSPTSNASTSRQFGLNATFGKDQSKARRKTRQKRSIRRFFKGVGTTMSMRNLIEDKSDQSHSSRFIKRNYSAQEGGNIQPLSQTLSLPLKSPRNKGKRGRLGRWKSSNSNASSTKQALTARTPDTLAHLNIFCSDMVSADFILSEMKQLEQDPLITDLELEDCLVTMTLPDSLGNNLQGIPQRLRDILSKKDRKWNAITLVDDLVNGWSYPFYLTARQQFLSLVKPICEEQNIPIYFKVKIQLADLENHHPEPTQALIDLLKQFESDANVVRLDLRLNTTPTNLELLETLTQLVQFDDREWEDVKLQLVTTNGEWTIDMHNEYEKLEEAARNKGLTGLC